MFSKVLKLELSIFYVEIIYPYDYLVEK